MQTTYTCTVTVGPRTGINDFIGAIQ